jgi:hypothetical protein
MHQITLMMKNGSDSKFAVKFLRVMQMSEKVFNETYTWDQDDREHDDYYTAEDYECKEYYRNGWDESKYERQRW